MGLYPGGLKPGGLESGILRYVFCFSSCFLFFARAWITVLYGGVIRIFLFNGFSSVFLSCAGVCCSVTELT